MVYGGRKNLECEFEPLERLRLAGVPHVAVGVVVEHDLELVRGARVVQQVRRELHHLQPQLVVLRAELRLHPLQPASERASMGEIGNLFDDQHNSTVSAEILAEEGERST